MLMPAFAMAVVAFASAPGRSRSSDLQIFERVEVLHLHLL